MSISQPFEELQGWNLELKLTVFYSNILYSNIGKVIAHICRRLFAIALQCKNTPLIMLNRSFFFMWYCAICEIVICMTLWCMWHCVIWYIVLYLTLCCMCHCAVYHILLHVILCCMWHYDLSDIMLFATLCLMKHCALCDIVLYMPLYYILHYYIS